MSMETSQIDFSSIKKINASGSEWIEQELSACQFPDERLNKRFKTLVSKLWDGIGETIPLVCQDWANTKAAYRFFSNPRVNEADILSSHFQSTRDRFKLSSGPILVLQDTVEYSYTGNSLKSLGKITQLKQAKDQYGHSRTHTVRGILMHSSLVVTAEGLPLGLSAIKFWTRKKFKGTNALKKHINPTRVSIKKKESVRWLDNLTGSTQLLGDPDRCIHIGDRESDIYELFCAAENAKTHFLVRTCVDRLAGDGKHTIAKEMKAVKVKGLHRIEVMDKKGQISTAVLELQYRRIQVLPPIGKQKKYPPLWLTVIHAKERDKPKNRERIVWKLMTDLPVTSRREAIEKIKWYAMRWKIETFHKILKSGCKAESSKLKTAPRLVNLIAIFCILSWRIFWLTMINRVYPNASAQLALRKIEIELLDYLVKDKMNQNHHSEKKLSHYLIKIAQLGGYLARSSDPPPGNMVMWRGLTRLTDIALGFTIGKNCG